MEPVLLSALSEISKIESEIKILQNISIPVNNRSYGYKPDIAIIWREKNIFIDIEIDEPYDLISRKPIHYKGCSDSLRNAYFLDKGWNIIHIAEKQIVDSCSDVVEFIKQCICQLSEDFRFVAKRTVENIERWYYQEAEKWAEAGYRESYLGIEKIAIPEFPSNDNLDAFEFSGFENRVTPVFIKPDEDILSDRYDDLRKNITEECKKGKYIVFSIRDKNYDYVALSDEISFTKKEKSYGIELYDVIEEKKYT